MASICSRCALRLRQAAQTETQRSSKRAFTATANHRRTLPKFTESTNEDLNVLLGTFREKLFIPATLRRQERKLVLKPKFRQGLLDNPQTVTIGEEDIVLHPIDPTKDPIPNHKQSISQAIDLITNGGSTDWQNLPALLQGLHQLLKKPISEAHVEKIMRKAIEADKFGVVLQCLQAVTRTGFSLARKDVLDGVLIAIHELGQKDAWSAESARRALKDMKVIVTMLDSEGHGAGRTMEEHDPRARAEVMGAYLEVMSVWALRHPEEAESVAPAMSGLVEKLLGRLKSIKFEPSRDLILAPEGARQTPFLLALPVWHGLTIARKVLGERMPLSDKADLAITNYGAVLENLTKQLEGRSSRTYLDQQALETWKSCIRD